MKVCCGGEAGGAFRMEVSHVTRMQPIRFPVQGSVSVNGWRPSGDSPSRSPSSSVLFGFRVLRNTALSRSLKRRLPIVGLLQLLESWGANHNPEVFAPAKVSAFVSTKPYEIKTVRVQFMPP